MLKLDSMDKLERVTVQPECMYKGFKCWRFSDIRGGTYVIGYVGLTPLIYGGREISKDVAWGTGIKTLRELKSRITIELEFPKCAIAMQGLLIRDLHIDSISLLSHSCNYAGFEIWQYEPTGEYVLRYTDFGHPAVVTTHAEIPRMCFLATGLRSVSSVKEFIKTKIRDN